MYQIQKKKKQTEFKNEEGKLSKKEKNLIQKKNILEENKFNDEFNKLKIEISVYREKKKNTIKDINNKKIKYTKIVLDKLNPIIAKYVEVNSISIVFPKKDIIVAKKKLDITKDIMNLLNDNFTKIEF